MEIKDSKGNVLHTNKIDVILARMKERGMFNDIIRYQYMQYDIEESLQIVEAIGKSRNPKFVIDDENRFTYTNLIKWVHCDTSMQCLDPETNQPRPARLKRGIYIAGNTGTGKSWALEIMLAYARLHGFKIKFDDQDGFLSFPLLNADEVCDKFTSSGTIDGLKKVHILGIQDLGAEPSECCYMGNRLNVLRNLIESRGDRTDTITLFTSNLPINHPLFVEQYDERVASRLSEMCNYLEIRGKDRRKL